MESICPFRGLMWRSDKFEVTEAQAPVQFTNFDVWTVPLGMARGEHGSVCSEIDGSGPDCGEKRRSQLAGIEAIFVKADESMISWYESGRQMGAIFAGGLGISKRAVA
jgi:hypothetical protein